MDQSAIDTVVVTIGGGDFDPATIAVLPTDAVVIAADGGLDHARHAGLVPDMLVGDLDSVSTDGLTWAAANITVERHNPDKASTDTELALTRAAALRPRRIVLVAGRGDRLDHAIAAIGALGHPDLGGIETIGGWWGTDELLLVRPDRPITITRPASTTFSVLAMHGTCGGVTITGSRWPLTDAELGPLVGLGVSNEVAEPPVTISVTRGLATVIIPGAQP